MPGSFRIARILGIDVRVHFSWLLIFSLVTFSLADQVFPFNYPQWSEQKTWIVAAIAALLFFVSVVLHEFAHSIVARSFKMSVSSITLFLLGGVASLTKEPPSAKAEFFMAIAGPATSLAIGGLSLGVNELVSANIQTLPSLQPVEAIAGYLGWVNILVAVFNMIPGVPLDGGRVLRSMIWGVRRDRTLATKIAARGGQVVAALFALVTAYRVAILSDASGLWMGLIAYFLYGAATQTLQQERVIHAVGAARVAELMTTDFVAVPRGTMIGVLVRDYLLPHNLRALPVVDDGRFVGLVTIGDLRKIEQDQWPVTPVDAVMERADDVPTVEPGEPLAIALDRFGSELPLLPVVERGVLRALLHRDSLLGYVRMREMLGVQERR
ncbi:MAG TPA: site-2 protease family protein [Candidatus Limnocylindrales bacterium]|nr:site-2 protease family protein [Candidatus Limnocylindrales bacterium]